MGSHAIVLVQEVQELKKFKVGFGALLDGSEEMLPMYGVLAFLLRFRGRLGRLL